MVSVLGEQYDDFAALVLALWQDSLLTAAALERLLEACSELGALERYWASQGLRSRLGAIEPLLSRGYVLIERYAEAGVRLLIRGRGSYPEQLRAVKALPVLSLRGQLGILEAAQMAVVGSRQLHEASRQAAPIISAALMQRGFILTSGGALGIDALVHRTAMRLSRPTILVTAGDALSNYPSENADIYDYCSQQGAVVSQFPLGTQPKRRLFPTRNMTIAGLAQGTVIVQAKRGSGALYTASASLRMGRPVYVLAMPAFDALCDGGLALLKRPEVSLLASLEDLDLCLQAKPQRALHFEPVLSPALSSPEPVLSPALSSSPSAESSGLKLCQRLNLSALEGRLLAHLAKAPSTREALRLLSGEAYLRFNEALLELELKGLVAERAGLYRLLQPFV